jgi:non-heme chloroperoxidase
MPAWIWQIQIQFFSAKYHVIALDPRAQGDSQIVMTGADPVRRGQDIAELIAKSSQDPVLLVGWSLGVLDSLGYLHQHGDGRLAGLVLVDNSVGEDPAPAPPRIRQAIHHPLDRDDRMRAFVRGMFRRPQPADWLDLLTATALRTPASVSAALLAYPMPRTYWREAVYATGKPILYIVRPNLAGQAANLASKHPGAESEVFSDAGHALFIDDAGRFDTVMQSFIQRRIWH